MNKLKQNLYTKKKWGSEIVWSLTDNYMAKTVEIEAGKQTYLVVHEKKEKDIIVIAGDLYLTYGECCTEIDAPVYRLPSGWSWHIEPGKIHKYAALDQPARLIEISTPLLEDGVMISDEKGVDLTTQDKKDIEAVVKDVDDSKKKLKKPRKKRVKTSQTKKKTQAKKRDRGGDESDRSE